VKLHKLAISEIANDTFNTGHIKFVAQFTESRKNVANYLQRSLAAEGYLVAETVQTGKKQRIGLPAAVDKNALDKDNLNIIRNKEIQSMTKRRQKLGELLMKGFATVYEQCSREVKEKLKNTENWEAIQREQCLHSLIQKIECICVGFDHHKQDVFNLVQTLKALFLYTQLEKDSVEEYGRNLKSLWDMVEAFGGSPGLHKGMMEALAKDAMRFANAAAPTEDEIAKMENEANKAVKAVLLISRANKRRYKRLKDQLANNYLLGTDQYPNTYKKGMQILGNNQASRTSVPFRMSPNDTKVAFLQRGGRGGCGGQGGQGKAGGKKDGTSNGSGREDMSTMTGKLGDGPRTNSKGESHCFHCGAANHWAYECPELTGDQQGQLHINLQAQDNAGGDKEGEGHQLLNITLAQGGALPDNRAYLDGCSTVTTFKNDKYLKGVKKVREGIKIICNAGLVTTNFKGNYGRLKVWYVPKGIANIFSMHKLKRLYCITYDNWDGYYVVHTPWGEVKFHKDK
jgi:hypothetical protein